MTNITRQLMREYCKHKDFAVGVNLVCGHCDTVQKMVSPEGDYGHHCVRHKNDRNFPRNEEYSLIGKSIKNRKKYQQKKQENGQKMSKC